MTDLSLCGFQGCTGCKCPPSVPPTTPFDVEIHEMELCTALKTQEECSSKETAARAETAMDDVQLEDEDEEEEAQRKDPQTQENTEDMVQKEERVEAETVKD